MAWQNILPLIMMACLKTHNIYLMLFSSLEELPLERLKSILFIVKSLKEGCLLIFEPLKFFLLHFYRLVSLRDLILMESWLALQGCL